MYLKWTCTVFCMCRSVMLFSVDSCRYIFRIYTFGRVSVQPITALWLKTFFNKQKVIHKHTLKIIVIKSESLYNISLLSLRVLIGRLTPNLLSRLFCRHTEWKLGYFIICSDIFPKKMCLLYWKTRRQWLAVIQRFTKSQVLWIIYMYIYNCTQ